MISQIKLAKALGVSRSTVQYYLSRGMPQSLEEAKNWLLTYKADKAADSGTLNHSQHSGSG